MPMGNPGDFDTQAFDMCYLLLENMNNTFYKEVFAAFYLINYAIKVAKLNFTKQYLRLKHQWAKNTIHIYIDCARIKLYKLRGA